MERMFQDTFDVIQELLPEGWSKVSFFAIYFDGGYTMKFYVKVDEAFEDCYSILADETVETAFKKIDKFISKERSTLDEKHLWNVMTMVVSSDGKMKTDFDYNDVSDDEIAYIRNWKKKYLQ